MKYLVFVSLFSWLMLCRGYAQIVLLSTDYPADLVGKDSIKVTTHSSLYPSFSPATSGVWNMDIVTDTIPYSIYHRVPASGYSYADSNTYHIGAYYFEGSTSMVLSSTGLSEQTLNLQYHFFSLTPITSGPYDTLFIPEQNNLFSSPLTKIAFPATHGAVWQSSSNSRIDFELSVSGYSLVHEPGFKKTYTDRKDTVTGWGKMRVKNPSGSPSEYFDVLQVQSTSVKTDSFFLTGAPAPAAILTMLALTQGKRDTTYTHYYYRKGEVTPLAEVLFQDASFSIPLKAKTHKQRLIPNQLMEISAVQNTLKVYPNPCFSKGLFIDLPAGNKRYYYRMVDISGKQILAGYLQAVQSRGAIDVPDFVTGGQYFIRVEENGNVVGSAAVRIEN